MYVREKKIRRGIGTWDDPLKVYSYWQVVQGTRVDGKVRQTVVAHIGTAEDREQADRVARRKGLLCGAPGCGAAPVGMAAWMGDVVLAWMRGPDGRWRKVPFLLCEPHLDDAANERLKEAHPAEFCKEFRGKPLV